MALKTWKSTRTSGPDNEPATSSRPLSDYDAVRRDAAELTGRKEPKYTAPASAKDDQSTPTSMAKKDADRLTGRTQFQPQTDRDAYAASLGQGGRGTRVLTAEEFGALTPEQQASVRASTQLFEAIKADRADAAGEGDGSYDKLTERLFPTFSEGYDESSGGSNAFSPRTLAVLNELGLGGNKDDLDNYLDFRALTTDADLGLNAAVKPAAGRADQQKALGEAAAKALAENAGTGFDLLGQAAIDDDGLSEKLRSALGANGPALGYGTEQVDSDLSQLFSLLSQRDNADVNAHWGDWVNGIKTDYGLTDEQIGTYFQNRLRDSSYDPNTETSADGTTVQLGSMGSSSYLTPTEFRQKYFGG